MPSKSKKYKIIACIPAYNEEKTIAKIVLLAQKYTDRVIVCDDGSTDMTADIARALGAEVIRHKKNMGYGAAIRTLLKHANMLAPDAAVTIDADGQHDPSDIPKLVRPIIEGKADIVIGSRFLAKTKIPTYRKAGIKIITGLYNIISKQQITDAQSGLRAYSRRALQVIVPKLDETGMGISLQILKIANQTGLKIIEVPIVIKYNVENPSKKNPLTHGAELVLTLTKILTLEQPLKYLGIPGALLLIAGTAASIQLILQFNQTRYFSIPLAIIALGLTLLGVTLITASLTFYALSILLKKIEQK